MRKSLMLVLILLTLNLFVFADEPADVVMGEPGAEYSGYIVTLKSSEAFEGEVCLMGESPIQSDISNEELVSLVDESLDSATALIPEIGMIQVEDEDTLEYLASAGLVEDYEPDYYMYLLGYDYTENPVFGNQWGHKYVRSSYAWNAGVFGRDVKVAVIDSGVYPHNDLKNNLLPGKNYTSSNVNDTTDTLGHGTFVAGIIAAECNNVATVGLAHRAKIVPFKITNSGTFQMSVAIQAMKDAVDIYDCDVLNLSLGSASPSEQLKNAVAYVTSKEAGGAILVAAAGNGVNKSVTDSSGNTTSYTDYEAYVYPASYDSVISVANAQQSGSSLIIRHTSTHNDKVDIAAPGTNVYSLYRSATGYTTNSGTSFATPYVSAAAALCKSVMPSINQPQFNMALEYSANPEYITETQGSDYWGHGLLDVQELIRFILMVNYGEIYVSPHDEQMYGDNTSIYVTNLSGLNKNFGSIVFYNHQMLPNGATRLNTFKRIPINLKIDETKEISLTQLGLSGDVHYSLVSRKAQPLIVPARNVADDEY